jgi:hypothetical protein
VRARKGVLITTSYFSQDALDYVQKIEKRIVLIDGKQLADLMIDHDIGVTLGQTYKIKRLDSDHFEGAWRPNICRWVVLAVGLRTIPSKRAQSLRISVFQKTSRCDMFLSVAVTIHCPGV